MHAEVVPLSPRELLAMGTKRARVTFVEAINELLKKQLIDQVELESSTLKTTISVESIFDVLRANKALNIELLSKFDGWDFIIGWFRNTGWSVGTIAYHGKLTGLEFAYDSRARRG